MALVRQPESQLDVFITLYRFPQMTEGDLKTIAFLVESGGQKYLLEMDAESWCHFLQTAQKIKVKTVNAPPSPRTSSVSESSKKTLAEQLSHSLYDPNDDDGPRTA
jgi:hypothetical protein